MSKEQNKLKDEVKFSIEDFKKLQEENKRLRKINEFVAFYREYLTEKNMVVEMLPDYNHQNKCPPEAQYCPPPLRPSVSFNVPIQKIAEKVANSDQVWVYDAWENDNGEYHITWDLENWTVGAEDYYKWRKNNDK